MLQKSEPTNQLEGDFNNEKFTEGKEVFALEQCIGLGKSSKGRENINIGAKLVSLCKVARVGIEA